ncbi:MAG: hypothetical protein RML56_14070 [Burkholderiales bacterium]|nr:hypothetical protein [Burkholderiales bacterium]
MAALAALSALILAFASAAAAAPFAVQLGAERIALDAPAGFADTGFLGSPKLQDLAESATSASNRVLLYAVPDVDVRRFMAGEPMELRRYALAATPRALERERVGEAQFGVFVAEALQALGRAAGAGDLRAKLDAQPERRPLLLAELRREPNVVTVLQGTRVVVEGRGFLAPSRTFYVLETVTFLLARGKLLQAIVFTRFDGAEDLEWIGAATARWIDELVRLNR